MKFTPALLILASALPALSQTVPAKPAATTTAAKPGAAVAAKTAACAKLPDLSPRIPALPAGAPCAKHLYTITTIPTVKLENVSPFAGKGLAESLGIAPVSFSLDYIDTKVGTGPLPGTHKFYTINYTGYLPDGTKFDSSLDLDKDGKPKDPITIPYGEHAVIAGWDTGFGGMHLGGKRRLFIPYQLGYGTQAKGPIPPKSMLIFDVELLSVSDTPPPARPKPIPPSAPPTPPGGLPGLKPAPAGPGAPPAAGPGAPPAAAPATPPAAAPATPPAAAPAPTPPTTDPTKPTSEPPAGTPPPAATPRPPATTPKPSGPSLI